jgi:hypothetical protein
MKVFALFGRPTFLRKVHGLLTVFWCLLWIAAFALGWLSSVVFVSHLSAIALILGSWSSWQAARVEVTQDEEIRKKQNE